MSIVLFYYTLAVLLVIILTAATCLSSYLVFRKPISLFACMGFLIYFFDVALVFQDDFIIQKHLVSPEAIYFIGNPLVSIITGAGLIATFSLCVYSFLGETRRRYVVVPVVAFSALSLAVLLLVPQGNWQEFLFYSMRSVLFFWLLLFIAVRYLGATDEVTRNRMWRRRRFYLLIGVLGTCVLLENVWFLLIWEPHGLRSGVLAFFPERNFAENALLLCCAFFAFRKSFQTLCLRFESPPSVENEPTQLFIEQNLMAFGKSHYLSNRESEVLHLILLGKSNSAIAGSLYLALSTVKVHTHNILQKTSCSNRQELIRKFWRTS
ncbi:MAG: helix-turn-helix transcriptional regulator [Coriobacteriales bacterium]|jgi:DNA-binding CsgD family transcriptional regulator|nr:helix-turn-helix transcriptional regulator [Coriobacteriales bacterium]